MRRLLSAAVLVAGLAVALVGCPEGNVDSVKYPDAWWLAGEDAGRADAALVPTDASVWIAVPPPSAMPSSRLNAIAANGSTMLAVGDNGSAISYDPSKPEWTKGNSTVSAQLNAVANVSAIDWWIVGSSKTVLRWDGSSFTQATLPGATSPDLKAVAASASQVFVAGAGGARFLYDVGTTTWTDQVLGAATTADITGLWYSGTTFFEVDALGGVYKYDAAGWRSETSLASKLLGIWGTSDADYWIVGDKAVWHYTGGFDNVTPADSATWNAVWGNGSGEVWIGSKEQGLLKWNGLAWERTSGFSLAGKDLFGIGGSSQVGTWSVGDGVLQQLVP
ncbi:MAG TPA: hypothetical protein VGK67_39225 [Myxococcales bacterium]|jgi:hypothetical protein